MNGKLTGKVALITGATPGQGRSHAVRLAEEGADIIAVDLLSQIDSVAYPMSTPADMDHTVRAVEALDRRIVTRQADVRDAGAMQDVVRDAVAQLGRLDIVLANAGIVVPSRCVDESADLQASFDVIAVNLVGVRHTVHAAVPTMVEQGEGGAVVITGSTQGMSGRGGTGAGGTDGYVAAKHGIVGLMRSWANWLAPHQIRVNVVHPTGVATPMVMNDVTRKGSEEFPGRNTIMGANLLPVRVVEPVDISNAIVWLTSDEGRYVTGVELPVDAGFSVR